MRWVFIVVFNQKKSKKLRLRDIEVVLCEANYGVFTDSLQLVTDHVSLCNIQSTEVLYCTIHTKAIGRPMVMEYYIQ